MKHPFLPKRAYRTIHTPAICDSGSRTPEARTSTGLSRSTVPIEAVHVCGLITRQPNAGALSRAGSRP